MKFKDFWLLYKNVPFIDSSTFVLYGDPRHIRHQVSEWVKKRYLFPLKRGMYVFSDEFRAVQVSSLSIANILISPSYVSMETALSFYDLIPEKAGVSTSITTKKTVTFKNIFGTFEYRSIQPALFFGYEKKTVGNESVFMAEPEKALVDFFYLNTGMQGKPEELDAIRLQNPDILNQDKMQEYGCRYPLRVQKLIETTIAYITHFKQDYRTV